MPADINVTRGCGKARQQGGVYLEVSLATHGHPLERYLVDPLMPMHPDDSNALPRVGVLLMEGPDGITHVIDWVGETHYPYATDFLEEGRRKGFSRKISPLVEVDRLTPGKSCIYFVHARGYLENYAAYRDVAPIGAGVQHCRFTPSDTKHLDPSFDKHCVRHLWGAPQPSSGGKDRPDGAYRQLWRRFTDFDYAITTPQPEGVTPAWKPAYVARLPITNITVVAAEDGHAHLNTLRSIGKRSRLPVYEASG